MNKLALHALVCAALTATSAVALAQGAPDVQRHTRYQAVHSQPERASRLPSERMEARLAYLKTALKITDAQQPQWNVFADTLRKQARAMDERMKARRARSAEMKRDAAPNTIERLERRQARHAAASARLREVLAAAKPLYAALSAEQQKIADELLAPQRRGHHRGRA